MQRFFILDPRSLAFNVLPDFWFRHSVAHGRTAVDRELFCVKWVHLIGDCVLTCGWQTYKDRIIWSWGRMSRNRVFNHFKTFTSSLWCFDVFWKCSRAFLQTLPVLHWPKMSCKVCFEVSGFKLIFFWVSWVFSQTLVVLGWWWWYDQEACGGSHHLPLNYVYNTLTKMQYCAALSYDDLFIIRLSWLQWLAPSSSHHTLPCTAL